MGLLFCPLPCKICVFRIPPERHFVRPAAARVFLPAPEQADRISGRTFPCKGEIKSSAASPRNFRIGTGGSSNPSSLVSANSALGRGQWARQARRKIGEQVLSASARPPSRRLSKVVRTFSEETHDSWLKKKF